MSKELFDIKIRFDGVTVVNGKYRDRKEILRLLDEKLGR